MALVLPALPPRLAPLTLFSAARVQITDWKEYEPEVSEGMLRKRQLTRGGKYLWSGSTSQPRIGDVRVSFRVAGREGAAWTAIGKQKNGVVRAFQTAAGDKLLMLQRGRRSAEEMFADARDSNSALTWVLRLAGWGLMLVALLLMASPVTTLGWLGW